MALKLIIEKLEDVEEPLRKLYVKKGDKYVLDAEDNDDKKELRAALENERKNSREMKAKIEKWEEAGKTPEEIKDLVAAELETKNKKHLDRGEYDKLLAQVNDKHTKALADKDGRIGKLTARLHDSLIVGPATAAISKLKGVTALLLPHVRSRVKVVEDNDDFSVRVVDAKGEPRVNGKGEFLTLDDLVTELRDSDDYSRAFEGTGSGGSGTRPGGGTGAGGSKSMQRAAFDALPPAERTAHVKAGGTVRD